MIETLWHSATPKLLALSSPLTKSVGSEKPFGKGFLSGCRRDSCVDAPSGKGRLRYALIGCFHVSGLFVRRSRPLALMEIRRRDP
jgi:hypothetical protein